MLDNAPSKTLSPLAKQALEAKKAKQDLAWQIYVAFDPYQRELDKLKEDALQILKESCDEPNEELTERARILRLAYRTIRTSAEAKRVAKKAPFLDGGRAIDAEAKDCIDEAIGYEKSLLFVENYFKPVKVVKVKTDAEKMDKLVSTLEGVVSKLDFASDALNDKASDILHDAIDSLNTKRHD